MCHLLPLVIAGLALGADSPGQLPTASAPAVSQPATTPGKLTVFQPGVWIDWQQREVQVETRVVLRSGALEFLACWPGRKHESIVRCEAAAAHVCMALGLIGLLPGHPPAWNPEADRYAPPAGDLVDISFQWEQDGRLQTADAFAWLRDVEYGRPPLGRPWVFAGSLRLPDGTLSADVTGAGIALVDFPDSLIALSRSHSSRNAELWVEANPAAPGAAIPSEGTRVRLVLRPAKLRPRAVAIDFRGVTWVDGRYCSVAELADVIDLARRLNPAYVQEIAVGGALRSDELRLRRALLEAGLPEPGFRFRSLDANPPGAAPVRGD